MTDDTYIAHYRNMTTTTSQPIDLGFVDQGLDKNEFYSEYRRQQRLSMVLDAILTSISEMINAFEIADESF